MSKRISRQDAAERQAMDAATDQHVRQLRSRLVEMAPRLSQTSKRTIPTIGLRMDPAGLRKVGS
jgi:hypothetical protein